MFLLENDLLARTTDDAPAASLFRAPPGNIRLFGCLRKLHATSRKFVSGSIRLFSSLTGSMPPETTCPRVAVTDKSVKATGYWSNGAS
jgi:hypothetical protein